MSAEAVIVTIAEIEGQEVHEEIVVPDPQEMTVTEVATIAETRGRPTAEIRETTTAETTTDVIPLRTGRSETTDAAEVAVPNVGVTTSRELKAATPSKNANKIPSVPIVKSEFF